jgi:hypothetical protein
VRETKFYLTSEFKSLENEWYQRLEESGFHDIENRDNPDGMLKTDRSVVEFDETRIESVGFRSEARALYFRNGAEVLKSYPFENETHRRIWQLHMDGLSNREIARKIEGMSPSYQRSRVGEIIFRIARGLSTTFPLGQKRGIGTK